MSRNRAGMPGESSRAWGARIREIKNRYGRDLVILGHYYMSPEVLEYADFVGDSYRLSREAAGLEAPYVVFCGVSFMAESARVLCRPEQRVFIPDHRAGCPLADAVTREQFAVVLEEATRVLGEQPVPVLYVNSSASVKADVGRAGGTCCTSSNAALISRRILEEGRRVLFLPDGNLGRNVAQSLGLEAVEVVGAGGREIRTLRGTERFLTWDGSCPVHQVFSVDDVGQARKKWPGSRVLVHPECDPAVVQSSDYAGSTEGMMRQAEASGAGRTLVIGTEANFVTRTALLHPELQVRSLRDSFCPGMGRITPEKLVNTLEELEDEDAASLVLVDDEVAAGARLALRRMIEHVERGG